MQALHDRKQRVDNPTSAPPHTYALAAAAFWAQHRTGYRAAPAFHVSDAAQHVPLSDVWLSLSGPGLLSPHADLKVGTIWICAAPLGAHVWGGDCWAAWRVGLGEREVEHPILQGLVLTLDKEGMPVWVERERAVEQRCEAVAGSRLGNSEEAFPAGALLDTYIGQAITRWYTTLLCLEEELPAKSTAPAALARVQPAIRPAQAAQMPASTPHLARRMRAHAETLRPAAAVAHAGVQAAALARSLAEKDRYLGEMHGRVRELQAEVVYARAVEEGLRGAERRARGEKDGLEARVSVLEDEVEGLRRERDGLGRELEMWRALHGVVL